MSHSSISYNFKQFDWTHVFIDFSHLYRKKQPSFKYNIWRIQFANSWTCRWSTKNQQFGTHSNDHLNVIIGTLHNQWPRIKRLQVDAYIIIITHTLLLYSMCLYFVSCYLGWYVSHPDNQYVFSRISMISPCYIVSRTYV